MNNIDQLIQQATLGKPSEKTAAQRQIWQMAAAKNCQLNSIYPLYLARAENKLPANFIIPAFNLRTLTYQTAQTLFRVAQKLSVGPFIFELARSEMRYTKQNPAVYVSNILAAAVKTDWQLPIFIQADHFRAATDNQDPKNKHLKTTIRQAIAVGFYQIDIDGSPLIDESLPPTRQQRKNAEFTAEIAAFIRRIQPRDLIISLGAEIGKIGGRHNSKAQDVDGFFNHWHNLFSNRPGLIKLAIQTGTSHGGTVDKNGQIVPAKVAFENIRMLSNLLKEKYGLAGIVQHGASTLQDRDFPLFAKSGAIEIHLATGLQNIILDHPAFPINLKNKIYHWLDRHFSQEKRELTPQQFHYRFRKKALGVWQKELWQMDPAIIADIQNTLAKRFEFFFRSFNLSQSDLFLTKYVKFRPLKIPDQQTLAATNQADIA